jgi:uncharacterized protein YifN (PemK superfamily)
MPYEQKDFDGECRIENGKLIIEVPISTTGELSKSQKSIMLATTSGLQKTKCFHDGKQITIGLNAFVSVK